ncbi:GAF domain-containing protein [Klenkia sp. PcliD-1-E]|uniref:GAF domain-containing protein n=1 Tax=Klenkia sp. PcliD-1-E TaxID=2954492 RepID=UPI0020978A49|nr:GAF domain-containing protein [Klenkia sp. PcliD-1-E]MCO7218331.1 GAF domain-containing protein [Klenkia sp. PcliD-1-E]
MTAVDLVAAFHNELATAGGTDLLVPDQLARACTAVLPFDGAGISMTLLPDRRLPLGASDETAASAERLQFAVGEGPCLTAQRTRTVIAATTAEQLHRRWPMFAHQLEQRTPYQGVVCLPVSGPLAGAVVLDLYRRRPGELAPGLLDVVRDIADVVGDVLAGQFREDAPAGLGLPSALRSAPIDARHQVWTAVGYLAGVQNSTGSTALATMRALAFTHDLDLETTADRILSGEITPS